MEPATPLGRGAFAPLYPLQYPTADEMNRVFKTEPIGQPERVLEFYEDEVRGNYFQPISATWFWHPTYEAVRRTARFKAVMRDFGFVDYWRARGWPVQCRAAGSDDFACD